MINIEICNIDIPSLLPTAGVAKFGTNTLKTTTTEIKTALNNIEADAMAKITQNLPKNGVYNQNTKLININGKDYGLAGFDITGQPVFGQIKSNKWTGNFRIFANGESRQTIKPMFSTNSNSSLIKDFQIEFYKNPYLYATLVVGGAELANDILNPSMPPETYFGKMYYIYDNWDKLENNIKIFFNKE